MDGVTDASVNQKSGETLHIEQSLEKPSEGHSVEITADEHVTINENKSNDDDDEEVEPSVLQALSSEQLARRPSFKKILDDLSSADVALHKNTGDPLAAAAAATLQAHQLQAAIQQVSAANPALIPGLFQATAIGSGTSATTSTPSATDTTSQLSMMLPSQQQLQLQSALLNASSGVVQSLAAQTNIPATILSSALLNANVAATLSAASSNSAGVSGLPGSTVKLDQTLGSGAVDDSSRKREVRLMKNREAARECRRKKKEYVRCLENRVAVLESQNQALIGELRALKELYLPKSQD